MRPVDALLEILRSEGVDRVFGNPGTTELPFIDALLDAPDLPYVLGLQEGSVVAMADGYARATGRPALVSLHVAAGVANGLIGMLNARRSRTPMVVVAGQQDRRHLVQDPMLSGDLVGIAAPASKSAVEVQHAYDLPVVLRRAFALAGQPPAGPVFVAVPMDLLEEEMSVEVPARSSVAPQGAAGEVDRAVAVLAAAARPAIVAGDGVGRDGAVEPLVAVAERLGATVYHQPMNDGIDFPGNHPLYAGMLLPRNAAIHDALARHDVVFVVGTHAFMAHHYTPGPSVPGGAKVVQLDTQVPEAAARLAAVADATAAERAETDAAARARYGQAPLDPLAAAHVIATALPGDAVMVEEAITVGTKLRTVLRQDRPGSYVHTVGGGLGWGIGAAVGSAMGRPDRPVAAVLGDGCAMFGIQGLWSAARYQVPVAFLVMNNGEYRILKETLDESKSRSTAQGRYVGLDLQPPALDWVAAAHCFGIPALRVAGPADLRDAVAGIAALDGPLLVEVPITGHGDEHGCPGARGAER